MFTLLQFLNHHLLAKLNMPLEHVDLVLQLLYFLIIVFLLLSELLLDFILYHGHLVLQYFELTPGYNGI